MNNPSYYHHVGDCRFDGSESQTQIENCDLGGLDDLDQSNSVVSKYLIDQYKDWVNFGFDGIRVDAARSVPKPWLKKFEKEMGVPTFGEIFVGDIDYVANYQNYQWGELDFPYFFAVRQAFSADTDMNALSSLFAQDYKYRNANRLETFLDNHDRARFLTWADDNYQRLRSALTFLMSSRGVPVIYYGTEQADDGNAYPLSWNSGRGARNIANNIWEYEFERLPIGKSFEFKPLIDDTTWSHGQNYTAVGGQTIDIYPTF